MRNRTSLHSSIKLCLISVCLTLFIISLLLVKVSNTVLRILIQSLRLLVILSDLKNLNLRLLRLNPDLPLPVQKDKLLLSLGLKLLLIDMCLAPITIKNPRYKQGSVGLSYLFNTHEAYIQVPCGTCPQCASLRQSFFLQRVQMESLRSHLFMFTLTYNDESLVYTDVGDYQIAYPEFSDVQKMFKRLRKRGYKFRYSYVSEYGSKRHRPHYHGIFALDKSLGDPRSLEVKFSRLFSYEWRRNYGDNFSPNYRPLFTPIYNVTHRCTTFDFHYIEPIRGHDNDVSFYVSKYITKYDKWIRSLVLKVLQDETLSDEETFYLVKCLKPRCNISKDFGDWKDPAIFSYIKKCAARKTQYRYPQFFDINTGKGMPMSPYYGRRLVDFSHMYSRFLSSDGVELDSVFFDDHDTVLDYALQSESASRQFEEFEKKLKKLEKRLDI